MTLPPFLLIMPSFNQAHYIASAVQSVLQQDDPNWLLWIVDNSTDDTPEVMASFTADPRIKFVHIQTRMDPGSCLNLILQEHGQTARDFSYIHTDNLLRKDYVRRMRAALSSQEQSLAHCDMRSLSEDGRYTGVFRRGAFDLANLFSFSPLGVPFAATTSLWRSLGGFSPMDVADDVIFCVRAWPKTQFAYVADAIMDYRIHANSRTTEHGGPREMERSFLRAYARLLPEMKEQGIHPVDELRLKLHQLQVDMTLKLQDIWYRTDPQGSSSDEPPGLQTLVYEGLIELCDFHSYPVHGCRPAERGLARAKAKLRRRWHKILRKPAVVTPQMPLMRRYQRRDVWEESIRFRQHAIPWLYLSAIQLGGASPSIRLASLDVYTLWITSCLHHMCGWRFQVDERAQIDTQAWPHLDRAKPDTTAKLRVSLACGEIAAQTME